MFSLGAVGSQSNRQTAFSRRPHRLRLKSLLGCHGGKGVADAVAAAEEDAPLAVDRAQRGRGPRAVEDPLTDRLRPREPAVGRRPCRRRPGWAHSGLSTPSCLLFKPLLVLTYRYGTVHQDPSSGTNRAGGHRPRLADRARQRISASSGPGFESGHVVRRHVPPFVLKGTIVAVGHTHANPDRRLRRDW